MKKVSKPLSNNSGPAKELIRAEHIGKLFPVKPETITVLTDISLTVEKGEFVIIFGPSGCGKSTLLHILLGLENPTQGKVSFLGSDLYKEYDDDGRAELRKKHIGIVYQQSNWIQSLTVRENVLFALNLNGVQDKEAEDRAAGVIRMVGLTNWESFSPSELSSGQQQKIALARAISTNPDIIVADEPTGNLDFESGQDLMNLLKTFNDIGKTIVMITHDLEYLKYAKRALRMFDGKLVEEIKDPAHYDNKKITKRGVDEKDKP